MSDTKRLTTTLPTDLVREIDEQSLGENTTRGVAIRRLIESALRDRAARERRRQWQRSLDEAHERGWRDDPARDEEFGWTTSPRVLAHLAEIPWEPSVTESSHASEK